MRDKIEPDVGTADTKTGNHHAVDSVSIEVPVLYGGKQISLTELLREIIQEDRDRKWKAGVRGKHAGEGNGKAGRHRGYTVSGDIRENKVDFAATLRAAAFHPAEFHETEFHAAEFHEAVLHSPGYHAAALHFPADHPVSGETKVRIRLQDIRYKRYAGKEKTGVLFVVDASRSQGARKRLAFAKGAVLSLLRQVYWRRDQAGMIIFGNRQARLVLPFTRSVEYAGKMLETLPASGNTPLAMGLRTALETVEKARQKDQWLNPVIAVVTDGKANYDEKTGNPMELALEAAAAIRQAGIPAVVIDTETGVFSLGLARKLAEEMNARYLKIDKKYQ